MKVTFRKQPNEPGLARVCQGPRGYVVSVDGIAVGNVSPLSRGFGSSVIGWYWVVGTYPKYGIPLTNTYRSPKPTKEEARDECKAFIREHMEASK